MLKFVTVFTVLSAVVAHQEGKQFLVVFPPSYDLRTSGFCHIIVNTNAVAEVSIHYRNTTEYITVDVGSSIHDLPCTIRAPIGYSDSGVLLESDVDISVQVYSTIGAIGDVYLALPLIEHEAEYILTSTHKPCGQGVINNFYTVTAVLSDTVIEVYAPGHGGYTLVDTVTIGCLESFTNGSTSATLDYTGWKLYSSFPISVVSGSACSEVKINSCGALNAEYIYSPSIDQAGHEFIVPKITKTNPGNSGGAYIRVISLAQNNLIQLPDQSIQETVHAGQFLQHYIYPYDDITRIECIGACIVILYNELRCSAGEGGFLLYVTPLDRGSEIVRFSAIESNDFSADPYFTNYITIIAQTTQVYFDGASILGWRAIPQWNYFDVAIPVTHGGHTLTSSEGTFVAFVYGHTSQSWGYGSVIVHSDSSPPVTTPTPTPPELPDGVPEYRISLVSNWTSAQDMENQCTNQYTNELRLATLQMAIDLNAKIGDKLCADFDNDKMSITSSTSAFFSSTTSGYAFVSFVLSPENHIAMGDVLMCAGEITAYSKPHIAWGAPLLDPIPNCANPVFETGVFYDGDHQWLCQNGKVNEEYSSKIPSYYLELVDVGNTDDDSDLSPECAFRYSLSLDDKALWMRSQLNSMIGNQLCQGISGTDVASPQTSFTVQGSIALIHIDYVLTHNTSVSGGEALMCAEDVFQYVQCYNSWQPPLLPPEPACPAVRFDNQCFDDTSRGWLCNI